MKIISLFFKGDHVIKLFFPSSSQKSKRIKTVMFTVPPNDVFEIIRQSNVFHTHIRPHMGHGWTQIWHMGGVSTSGPYKSILS